MMDRFRNGGWHTTAFLAFVMLAEIALLIVLRSHQAVHGA